jgi:magnesium transporter
VNAYEEVARAFLVNHPEEAARELERADPAHAARVLSTLTPAVGAEVYAAIGPAHATACSGALAEDSLAAIITWMPPDAGAAVVRRLDEVKREAVLALLDQEARRALVAKLVYADNTAGALADALFPALPEDLTVAEAWEQLRGSRTQVFHDVYVVTRDRVLVGVLTLPDLMGARPGDTLGSLTNRSLVRLDAHAELATVAAHPAWLDDDVLPVVDGTGRFVGAIRHRSIRRASTPANRALLATLVGLSEVYWAGLSGILASLSPPEPSSPGGADAH